jgi:hypothetical protein
MSDLLFDTPLWILAGLAIVGISLFVAGNNRTDATLRNVGLGVILLGVLLFAVSWFIDTDKEKATKFSRQVVKAVEARDWPVLEQRIAGRFKVTILGSSGVVYGTKKEMIDAVKTAVDRFDLKSAKVTKTEASDTGDYIKVLVSVYSEQGYTAGFPLTSGWEFDWQEGSDGWQLTEIIALSVGNRTGDQIRGDFPGGRR